MENTFEPYTIAYNFIMSHGIEAIATAWAIDKEKIHALEEQLYDLKQQTSASSETT